MVTNVQMASIREVNSRMRQSIRPKFATFWSFHRLIESMEGPREPPANCHTPRATALPAEDIAAGQPEGRQSG